MGNGYDHLSVLEKDGDAAAGAFPLTDRYGRMKERIMGELAALESCARRREAAHLAQYIGEVAGKLRQDRFNLVVLGEFKRGKTTFLNALLGAEILPTAVVPLTSIVTVIQYGESLKSRVLFLNGEEKEVSLDEVACYVTEEGNPKNEKKVKLVQLEYPSPYLKEGVLLIDTPGVGSIYQNNTDETYSYLPKVDAAIFMLSADQPLSRSECGFLKEIKHYSVRTFFILNKIDYLEEKDRPRALDFARKALEEEAGFANANITPLSAKMALEGKLKGDGKKLSGSNLPEFIKVLEQFLLTEKGAATLRAACSKGMGAADELQAGLDLEAKALLIPLEELQAKIGLFDAMVENLSQEQQDNRYIFQGEMDKVYHELEREITRFQESRQSFLEKSLDRLYQEKKNLSGRELLKSMDSYVESAVRSALEEWRPVLEEKVRAAYEKVVARFTDKTNRVIGELLRQSAEIFEISVEGFVRMDALTGETRLYYIFGEEKSMLLPDPVTMSAIFLPRFIAGPMILREMKKKVERELDRNCGRIRTDYTERIFKSARAFQNAFEEKFSSAVDGTRAVLTRAVGMRRRSQDEVQAALSGLNELKEKISLARNRLADVMERIS
ncbi:MAG: dynamin family protein [Peptococcaceae bacterium]|nr:dynamin family protein [Peptococcaceae bacterium]